MKKRFTIRLAIMTLVLMFSFIVFENGGQRQKAEDQRDEAVPVTIKKRPIGEFLIWESVSRYIMASYH
jgi:hypothetical protein